MAAIAEKISLAEFEALHGHDDTRYEYWGGRAIQKPVPKWMHGVLQAILAQLLWEAGYKSAPEVELRIVPNYHPQPDLIATKRKVEQPYPTSAVEVVIEILSEDDKMEYLLDKCAHYTGWGCEQVYVVDPMTRRIYRWNERGLQIVPELASIPGEQIWAMLEQRL